MQPKIDKNGHLALSVSIGCPPGPMITKMVPQVPKIRPEGLQYDRFRLKNTNSSSQPASSFLHPRGPAAGAKP